MSLLPIAFTGATLTIDRDVHSDTIISLNRAAGMTVNLPAAVGSGDVYRFYVVTTFTGSCTIAALGTDIMQGAVSVASDISGVTCPTTATSDKIVMNGGTQGGAAGTFVQFQDVASATWNVTGHLTAVGAEATPFSAT